MPLPHQARRDLGGYLHIHRRVWRYQWRDTWSDFVSIVYAIAPLTLTMHAGSDTLVGSYAGMGGSASIQ